MLSEDNNTNGQAEAKKNVALILRVSYPKELTHKLNTAIDFVVNKIGFTPLKKFRFVQGSKYIILYDANGDSLDVGLEILEVGANPENIIFHTDDCLKDYHKYLVAGVEFINRPEYNAAGLQVRFIDDESNCYTLLEERTYNESL